MRPFVSFIFLLILGVSHTCEDFKQSLSRQIGVVASCFSVHMSPISLCGWCLQPLMELQDIISNQSARSPSGSSCMDIVISTDKAAVSLLHFTSDIWNRSFCHHCLSAPSHSKPEPSVPSLFRSLHWPSLHYHYDTPPSPGEDMYNLKVYNNNTVEFFQRLFKTLDCLAQHMASGTVSILDTLSFPSVDSLVPNRSACATCATVYYELTDFYHKKIVHLNLKRGEFSVVEYGLYANSRFAVCSDVQYAMNRTQWAWSNLMRCDHIPNFVPQVLLPIACCVVTIVLFHILACTIWRNPVRMLIYQPKRVEPVQLSRRSNLSGSARPLLSNAPSYGSVISTPHNLTSSRVTHHCRL